MAIQIIPKINDMYVCPDPCYAVVWYGPFNWSVSTVENGIGSPTHLIVETDMTDENGDLLIELAKTFTPPV